MKIDFVVPPVDGGRFSGGLWCLFQYADGLAQRGHKVRVVPTVPSPQPKWFGSFNFEYLGDESLRPVLSSMRLRRSRSDVKVALRDSLDWFLLRILKMCSYEVGRGAVLGRLRRILQSSDADLTVASHFETALPVKLYGSGRLVYFGQHYEPLFAHNLRGGALSVVEAHASYHLGLKFIANSSWLLDRVGVEEGLDKSRHDLCLNAINHEYFYPKSARGDGGDPGPETSIRIISYDGNGLDWKGFSEMAAAMEILREGRPELQIEWRVYGSWINSENGGNVSFEKLGFLSPAMLGDAYRESDILLSASWYESFPLFPLEAMACGLAVITSAYGTEDYAIDGSNCLVIEAGNVDSIASALMRLVDEPETRRRLSAAAARDALTFTWSKSVDTMEEILTRLQTRE